MRPRGWGDPVAHSATSLSKTVKRALKLAKKADKRSKTALARANTALARGGPTGRPARSPRWSPASSAPVSVPLPAGNTAVAMATCQAGEKLVSGGWRLSNLLRNVTRVVDRPADAAAAGAVPSEGEAPTAWRVVVIRTDDGTATELTAFAVCAT